MLSKGPTKLFYCNFEKKIGKCVKNVSPVQSYCSLRSLNRFLDYEVILRVGANLKLKFSRNHTINLPKKSRYTRLLVVQLHQMYLHNGSTTLE